MIFKSPHFRYRAAEHLKHVPASEVVRPVPLAAISDQRTQLLVSLAQQLYMVRSILQHELLLLNAIALLLGLSLQLAKAMPQRFKALQR